MPLRQTLTTLLETATDAAREAAVANARIEARKAWVRRTIANLRAAQQQADDAWGRLVEAHPDADEDLPPPPEQAAVDAIWAELNAVRERDLWPKELYWSL